MVTTTCTSVRKNNKRLCVNCREEKLRLNLVEEFQILLFQTHVPEFIPMLTFRYKFK